MEKKENNLIETDMLLLLGKVWQKKLIIILATLLFAGLSVGYNKFLVTPLYQSTTKLYVVSNNDNQKITTQDVALGNLLVKDYKEIILSNVVLSQVVSEEGLPYGPGNLARKISISSPTDTRVLSISVMDENPNVAANLANKLREIAAEHIIRVTKVTDVTLIEEARPNSYKAFPRVARRAIFAAGAGFFLSFGVVILKELLDDRIRRAEDVEEELGLVLLGIVPNTK